GISLAPRRVEPLVIRHVRRVGGPATLLLRADELIPMRLLCEWVAVFHLLHRVEHDGSAVAACARLPDGHDAVDVALPVEDAEGAVASGEGDTVAGEHELAALEAGAEDEDVGEHVGDVPRVAVVADGAVDVDRDRRERRLALHPIPGDVPLYEREVA